MARLIFFASIREELGYDALDVELDTDLNVSALIKRLGEERGPAWQAALSADNVRIAVNQELITDDVLLANDDEVAFFPPVTGG